MKKCPYCAEEIQADAIKCRHCRSCLEVKYEYKTPEPLPRKADSIIGNKVNLQSLSPTRGWVLTLVFFILAVGCLGGLVYVVHAWQVEHLNSESKGKVLSSQGKTITGMTPAMMNRRIDEAAIEDQPPGSFQILRVAFSDIAFPADWNEYVALNGNAILYIAALSQDRGELPLKKVYVLAGGKKINLTPVDMVLSQQQVSGQTARIFGSFRADAFYLVPLMAYRMSPKLLVDFAKDAEGFSVVTLSAQDLPSWASNLPMKEPIGTGPSKTALKNVLIREYPGFLKEE